MKFRKKPGVIEATQWFKNGDHPEDDTMRPFEDTGKTPTEPREGKIVRYFRRPEPEYSGNIVCRYCGKILHLHGWIDTLQGDHMVCPGDWIITEAKGTYYPCKPGIFKATYEPEKTGYRKVETDSGYVMENGSICEPVATLADEYGGRVQIDIDDHCYVLRVKGADNKYRTSAYIFRQAFEVLKTLPSPK